MMFGAHCYHLGDVFVQTERSRELSQIHIVYVEDWTHLVWMSRVSTGAGALSYLTHVDKVEWFFTEHGETNDLAKSVNSFMLLIWVLNITQKLEFKLVNFILEDTLCSSFKLSQKSKTIFRHQFDTMLLLHICDIGDLLRHHET